MKINIANPKYPDNQYFKGKVIDFNERKAKSKGGLKTQKSTAEPRYYQSLLGIKNVITASTRQNEIFSVELNDAIINKFLTNKKGKTDEHLKEQFISIFRQNVQETRDEIEKINQMLIQNQTDNQNNIIEISDTFRDDDFCEYDETQYDYKKEYMLVISNDIKKDLIARLIMQNNDDIQRIPQEALNKTIKIFILSKTQKGTDLSDIEDKKSIIDTIENIKENYGLTDKEELELLEKLNTLARDDFGKLDKELIEDTYEITDYVGDFSKAVEILKRAYSKDKKNKNAIKQTAHHIFNSYFSDNIENVETFLGFCFDKKNRFSYKRAKELFELNNACENFISDTNAIIFKNLNANSKNVDYEKMGRDYVIITEKMRKTALEIGQDAIIKYFSRKDNGLNNPYSPSEYMYMALKGLNNVVFI